MINKNMKKVTALLAAIAMSFSVAVCAQADATVDYGKFGSQNNDGSSRINPGDYVADITTIATCEIVLEGVSMAKGCYVIACADKVNDDGSWIFEQTPYYMTDENCSLSNDGVFSIKIPCAFTEKCFNNANINIYGWDENKTETWTVVDVKFYDANGDLCKAKDEPALIDDGQSDTNKDQTDTKADDTSAKEDKSGDTTDKKDDASTDDTVKPAKTPNYKLKSVKGKLMVYAKGKPVTGKKQIVKIGTKKYAINKKGVVYTNKLSVKIGKEYYKCDKNGVANLRK